MESVIYLIAVGILVYGLWKTPPSRLVYALVIIAMLFLALTPAAGTVRSTITDVLNTANNTVNNTVK